MTEDINDGPVSRIEWVERRLRQDILDGVFDPGQRLLTAQLAEVYSVSPTPLREVLHRFVGEGLVEFIPQKGCRVTVLSRKDADELSDLRLLLDLRMLTDVVIDDRTSAEVMECSSDLVASWTTDQTHSRTAERHYRRFYNAVGDHHPSSRLRHQATLVRELGARYRLAAAPGIAVGDLIDSQLALVEGQRSGSHPQIERALAAQINTFNSGFDRQFSAVKYA